MGRKGGSRHLKRMPAPRFWRIAAKEFQWAIKPRPGPHPVDLCIPLGIVLRDHLGLARTAREAKLIVAQGKVKVDGRFGKDEKYPVGLMDVIEIAGARGAFRMLPVEGKGLTLVETTKEEAGFKLCRIRDKRTIDRGNLQINLHDGRNLLVKLQNPSNPVEDVYSTGASLQIEIPSQKILKHMKVAEGAYAIVTGGRNIGRHGKISGIVPASATRPAIVEIKDDKGETFRTNGGHVFVVGEEGPAVKLAGA